jgi:predicted nucleic acid-binding protein
MLHVVLDSNAVILDLRASAEPWRRLLRAVRDGRARVYLPAIVVDEVLAHRSNRFQPDVANAVTALRALVETRADPLIVELFGEREHVTILPYPDTPHRAVAGRALARRRPFDAKGHDGYRDTLVWETVLALARALPGAALVLVSQNRKDFADAAGRLHGDLRDDVAGQSGASVRLVHDLAALRAEL